MTSPTPHQQLSGFWRTRPVRTRGPLAGVGAGIAYRYGIDPVLVRVAFIVSAIFGGSGIVLYLAAYLLMPKWGDRVSPTEALLGRGTSSVSTSTTVMVIVAFAIALSVVGPLGIGLAGSGFIFGVLMLLGWWVLYTRKPIPPVPPQAPTAQQTPGSAQGSGVSGPWGTVGQPTAPAATTPFESTPIPDDPAAGPAPQPERGTPVASTTEPPTWDPLGVAPFAWDLPEPTPPAPEPVPKEPRSRIAPLFLGLAILTAAVGAGLRVATGAEWLTAPHIGAMALAVLGVGLVVAGIRGRGYVLHAFAWPLAALVLIGALAHQPQAERTVVGGEQTWAPTTEQLASSYANRFGSSTLDLRGVTLTADTTVEVSNRFGQLTVLVPRDMHVQVDCPVVFAAGDCNISGGSGPVLNLDINTVFGNSEVQRVDR